jgi:hypothetical protein
MIFLAVSFFGLFLVILSCDGFSVSSLVTPNKHNNIIVDRRTSILNAAGVDDNNNNINNNDDDNLLCAAVLVPGFLTGADEFQPLCQKLTEIGLPTVALPMPNWHWLPCIGGRSARPILERIDFTVKHLIANDGDVTKIPPYKYSLRDTWIDFRKNPGGIFKVGGSSRVEDYPIVEPRGDFPLPQLHNTTKKVALIGHRYATKKKLEGLAACFCCLST